MTAVSPNEEKVTLFAESDFRAGRRRFGIKRKDRRHHMYIVGKTGMGKSTLLKTLVLSDLWVGNGLGLLDPHGDLAEAVLASAPAERQDDLIVLDPSIPAGRVPYNPLSSTDRTRRHLVASGLVTAFRKIWADSWGPRMEYILYNTLRALADFPGASLLDVPRMLTDNVFRETVLRAGTDPRVAEFWRQEFAAYSPYLRAEALAPTIRRRCCAPDDTWSRWRHPGSRNRCAHPSPCKSRTACASIFNWRSDRLLRASRSQPRRR